MDKLGFCESFVHLNGGLISFADRPYLPAIYASGRRNLVLRCSRQTEKSTFLSNTILHEACTYPGTQILFVSPRVEQARMFVRIRLFDSLDQSKFIRRALLGKNSRRPQQTNVEFKNGSRLFVRAAFHSGDSCRGLSAHLLLVDEFQDIAEGDLPVLQETLSHALKGRIFLTGTPKSVDNHLEAVFRQSTANEWTITCTRCRKAVILDERSLGPRGLVCPQCLSALDPRSGRWVARNPQARWGDGFWISHLMVPWINYDEILDRQRTYDLPSFKNEVLGLSTATGDSVVTRGELEACCGTASMAQTPRDIPTQGRQRLIAGIDWGGGGTSRTVLVLGYMDSAYNFRLCRFERFQAQEEPERILNMVAKRCAEFQVRVIAADGGGNGHVLNRLLLNRLGYPAELWAIIYSVASHEPQLDGVLVKWIVHRSATIGVVFSRVKNKQITFPRVDECGSYLDEFACEISEYNNRMRTVQYTHPETMPDDALHATNYALQLAVMKFSSAKRSTADCE